MSLLPGPLRWQHHPLQLSVVALSSEIKIETPLPHGSVVEVAALMISELTLGSFLPLLGE